jgi:hypothetical protein
MENDPMRGLRAHGLVVATTALIVVAGCAGASPSLGPTATQANGSAQPTSPSTPGPTATLPTATGAPATPVATSPEPTRVFMSTPHGTEPGISVILGPGWGIDDHGRLYKGTEVNDIPEAMVMFWSFPRGTQFLVWSDPCRWESTQPETSAATVDAFASALAAQRSRDATQPQDVTIGGYTAKTVTLHVPKDVVFADCEGSGFQTYGTDQDPGARSQQGPGQIDQLWLTNVGGSIVVIDAMYRPDTAPELVDEMTDIAQSTAFDTSLPSGMTRHVLSTTRDGAVGITVVTPASGWSGDAGGWTMEWGPDGFDPPRGAGVIAYVIDKEFYVYGDPCNWQSTRPQKPATTVDELISALGSQTRRDPSTPQDITTADGHVGKMITLHVPDDAVMSACDEGTFATFAVPVEAPALYAQGPGEIDEIWIVDADGRIALIEGGYFRGTPQTTVEELRGILASAVIE